MASDDTRDDPDDSVGELVPEDLAQPEAEMLPDDPSADLGPDPPRVPDTASNDADPELKKQFWSLVLIFNVALFATSLGAMLVGFEGRWKLGGGLIAVGAFAFARGWRRYQRVMDEHGDTESGGDADEPTADATGDDAGATDAGGVVDSDGGEAAPAGDSAADLDGSERKD